ncbi:hypothetical protein BDV98DRAFT_604799 [Pterulicium gracile]|uniref:Uncharacterized protein n=1 Tax=Pterulicium gracile TaxID=1884261 RepID=A0A5C3QG56_9AGAR|nr:hypothetical protein BDV98DRAFT_604799 [Pterula gracilis]
MENTTSCAASMNHLHVLEENKRLRAEVARLRIQLKSEEDATRNPVTLAYHTDTKEEHTPEASVLGVRISCRQQEPGSNSRRQQQEFAIRGSKTSIRCSRSVT